MGCTAIDLHLLRRKANLTAEVLHNSSGCFAVQDALFGFDEAPQVTTRLREFYTSCEVQSIIFFVESSITETLTH